MLYFTWAKDYYAVIKENIARLQGNIKEYKAILKSPDRLKEIFATELDELKKLKL